MPSQSIARGNESIDTVIYLPSVVVPNVSANSSASQSITVQGINIGDLIGWNQQGVIAGLAVDNVYASANNTLSFYWTNTTGSNLNSNANQAFLISVTRPENAVFGLSQLPSVIE